MPNIDLIFTAIALAMDAVAVSIASSLSVRQVKFRDAIKMAAFFGGFQLLMPLIGYTLGITFAKDFTAWSHWIAFIVLAVLGIITIVEARHAANEKIHSPFRTNKLIVLSIATSLDALAVGATFSLPTPGLTATVIVIGVITFALCLPAVWFGSQLGKKAAKGAEVLGGVVLIAIGTKILIERLLTGP
jgi:putative Mn2+ efflux pump MntP